MIIDRYLLREIMKPFSVICGTLVVIFASYTWVRILGKAVEAELPTSMVFTLVFYRVAIALEMLIPISLFLSIVLGLGRLHTELEMTAISASGASPLRVVKVVFLLSVVVAVIVGTLTLFLRPVVYKNKYELRAQAAEGFSAANIDAGRFYERKRRDGTLIIFVEDINREKGLMKRVFVQNQSGNQIRVISAKEAYEQIDPVSGQPVPVLIDGHEYKLSSDGEVDRISEFKKLTIYPKEVTLRYKHKSASTFDLAQSQDSEGIAEYQWRLSTPLSAILLALLGIPLSRATPRQGKYSKIFLAMIAFAIYHNLGAIAKTWVEQGVVPPIPGIWWVHGLLAIILLAIYRPYLSLTR